MAVKPIPEGYHTVTPYLVVKGVAKLLDFLEKSFDAEKTYPPHTADDATIIHAELRIGDSTIMMGEAGSDFPPMPSTLYLYVKDCDALYHRAIRAGAISVREPRDQFYGDRNCGVKDKCGNIWWIATHIEDISHEELQRRAREFSQIDS